MALTPQQIRERHILAQRATKRKSRLPGHIKARPGPPRKSKPGFCGGCITRSS